MTPKQRFRRLYWFIRDLPKFRIRVLVSDKNVRGQAHLYRRRPCLIELRASRRITPRDYDKLTASLIHEYGHCVLRYTPHTEREAWTWGLRSVPKEVRPPLWSWYKRACLNTYPRDQRDGRYCGAFGRKWKWGKRGKRG